MAHFIPIQYVADTRKWKLRNTRVSDQEDLDQQADGKTFIPLTAKITSRNLCS